MGRIIYSDGRTALTTTAFRYKLTDSAGTLVKDWTTGVVWTQEPAGTFYYDDAAAVPGTRYAVEPATGEVGGAGMVPWGAPDNATIAAAAASAASADSKATTLLARNNPLNAAATQAAAQAAIVAEGVSTFNATSDPVEVGGLSVDGATDVRDALGMAAADLDDQMDAIAGALTDGTGNLPLTFRALLDSDNDGIPDEPLVGVADVRCTLTTDEAGTQAVGSVKLTDTQGYARWYGLAAGTYYLRREKARMLFDDDPLTITVAEPV